MVINRVDTNRITSPVSRATPPTLGKATSPLVSGATHPLVKLSQRIFVLVAVLTGATVPASAAGTAARHLNVFAIILSCFNVGPMNGETVHRTGSII